MIEYLNNLDAQALFAINHLHTSILDVFMKTYTGRFIWAPFYMSLLWFLWKRLGWVRTVIVLSAIIATICVADQTCATLLRPIFERPRPSHSDNPILAGLHIVNNYRGGSYGFPSCHAANSIALTVWFIILCRWRSPMTWLLVFWALLTCYTRMYLGVHYPGDLLFGALVGTLAALLCYGIMRLAIRMKPLTGRADTEIPLATYGLLLSGMMIYALVV